MREAALLPDPLSCADVLPTRAPRILLAEDDAAFRSVLRETLEAEGYSVHAVASGHALHEALTDTLVFPDHRKYDVVISDVRMPGPSGLDELERHHVRDPKTRFLLITAFGDRATHARASEFGVEVLDKPFEMDELLLRIHALLEGWGSST